jgi:putative acetyltransferase
MWASADLWELTDGTPESVAEWLQISDLEEFRGRILSGEKTLVATWNEIVVGFIAFKRGNHLSLLFVRKDKNLVVIHLNVFIFRANETHDD